VWRWCAPAWTRTKIELDDADVARVVHRYGLRTKFAKHEAARRAIVERSARLRLDEAVTGSAARGASRYRDLLDRLGQA
jgi:Arc/MetJ family transcription regulator